MARPPAYKRSQAILRGHSYPELLPEPARSQYYLTLAQEKAEREALNERLRAICAAGRAAGRIKVQNRIAERRRRLAQYLAANPVVKNWSAVARQLGCDTSTLTYDLKALGVGRKDFQLPICDHCHQPIVPSARGDAPPAGTCGPARATQ